MVSCIGFLLACTATLGLSDVDAAQRSAAQGDECQAVLDDRIDAPMCLLQQAKDGHLPQLAEHSPMKVQGDIQKINELELAKKLSSESKHAQPQGGAGTSTYKNWFQRMADSLGNFIASPFMMCFAISVMWLNERRNARMETLISLGRQDVVENAKSSVANPENRGCLVHMKSGRLHGVGTLIDDNFTTPEQKTVELSNIIKWKTVVQVYQWREERHEKKEKDRVGGGETTKVWYTYHKEWSSSKHDSTRFHETYGHENSFVAGSPYISEKTVDKVEYGDGFLLPNELVSKLNDYVDASDSLSKEGHVMTCDEVIHGNFHFSKGDSQETDSGLGSGVEAVAGFFKSVMEMLPGKLNADMSGLSVPTFHYYWRENVQTYRGGDEPHIGDYRVAFRCVPDGLGTVLALQAETDDGQDPNRDTFLPYRVIERRWCGWTEKKEKKALLKEGRKSDEELEEQDRCCGGACFLCCCCCNLVNILCSYVARPQIFTAYQGEKSVSQCFSNLKQSNTTFTWLIRLLAWILMNVALDMFLSPLTTFLDVIPLIGWLGNKAIGIISAFVSFVITLLIISAAYLVYHPSIGIPMLAGVLLLASSPFIINAMMNKNK